MRLIYMIAWDPRTMFGLAMISLSVWVFTIVSMTHIFMPCDTRHESGARCAAGNIPHSHTAHRALFAYIVLSSLVHPMPETAVVAGLEVFLIHYHSIRGHRFFFDLPFSL